MGDNDRPYFPNKGCPLALAGMVADVVLIAAGLFLIGSWVLG
jgi:hypothetical protein